jgi:hypothetical protein
MMFFDTNSLILTRRLVIFWVTLAVAPWEHMFDAVEDELESRGVNVTAGHL